MRIVFAIATALALLHATKLHADPPAKPQTAVARVPVYPVSYVVDDLPVWQGTGSECKFAPDMLMSFIRLSVDRNSWQLGAEMRPLQRQGKAMLVIVQTRTNHEQIADMFQAYRQALRPKNKGADKDK